MHGFWTWWLPRNRSPSPQIPSGRRACAWSHIPGMGHSSKPCFGSRNPKQDAESAQKTIHSAAGRQGTCCPRLHSIPCIPVSKGFPLFGAESITPCQQMSTLQKCRLQSLRALPYANSVAGQENIANGKTMLKALADEAKPFILASWRSLQGSVEYEPIIRSEPSLLLKLYRTRKNNRTGTMPTESIEP